MTELMMSKACGFSGNDIMFSSNDTPLEEFAYAAKLGAIINLDDITHIECGADAGVYSLRPSAAALIPAVFLRSAMILWIILAIPSTV